MYTDTFWYSGFLKTSFQETIDAAVKSGQIDKVAKAAGTSQAYLIGHLYYGRREPRLLLGFKLAEALHLDIEHVADHFKLTAAVRS